MRTTIDTHDQELFDTLKEFMEPETFYIGDPEDKKIFHMITIEANDFRLKVFSEVSEQ